MKFLVSLTMSAKYCYLTMKLNYLISPILMNRVFLLNIQPCFLNNIGNCRTQVDVTHQDLLN